MSVLCDIDSMDVMSAKGVYSRGRRGKCAAPLRVGFQEDSYSATYIA